MYASFKINQRIHWLVLICINIIYINICQSIILFFIFWMVFKGNIKMNLDIILLIEQCTLSFISYIIIEIHMLTEGLYLIYTVSFIHYWIVDNTLALTKEIDIVKPVLSSHTWEGINWLLKAGQLDSECFLREQKYWLHNTGGCI